MKSLFFVIVFFKSVIVCSSENGWNKTAFELQLLDKFACMLDIKFSLHQKSITERYKRLDASIALLKIGDDEIKQLMQQVDLLKGVIGSICRTCPQKKLPDDIIQFLQDTPLIAVQTRERLQYQLTRSKNFLISFVQELQQENISLHTQNNELRKAFAELEEKYNACYMKNFFDLVHDKKTMQFFGAIIGLIVFMNASTYWDLNAVEHMIMTGIGLSGFFSFVLRLYH